MYFTAGELLRSRTDRTTDKSDHQNGPASTPSFRILPYAKLERKEINFNRDTWLKEPMSRLRTDMVQRTGSCHSHKITLTWPPLMSTQDHGNNRQSIAAASRRESEKRPGTGERAVDGRRGQHGRPAEGAADGNKRCNCQASVRVYGRPTGK